jgi:hypothetical protein
MKKGFSVVIVKAHLRASLGLWRPRDWFAPELMKVELSRFGAFRSCRIENKTVLLGTVRFETGTIGIRDAHILCGACITGMMGGPLDRGEEKSEDGG